MEESSISVIVPIYNVRYYLDRCIQSILRQTFSGFEIVLVDDGSTDGSSSIADRYCNKYKNIINITKPNGGLSSARNAGIEVASGRYLAFVDSDDFIDEKMLESMYALATQHDADIVSCELQRFEDGKGSFDKSFSTVPHTFENMLAGKLPRAAWSKIYKKSLFIDNGVRYPIGLYHEDIPTTCKLYFLADKIVSVDEHFYFWTCRKKSITASIGEKHINDLLEGHCIIKNFLFERSIYGDYKEEFIEGLVRCIDGQISRIRKNEACSKKKNSNLLEMLVKKIKLFGFIDDVKYGVISLQTRKCDLYQKSYEMLFVEGDNLDKTKEQLNEELKLARIELHYKGLGSEQLTNFINFDFNLRLNNLIEYIQIVKKKYSRIAVYGNGLAGKIVVRELYDHVSIIVDRAETEVEVMGIPICKPDSLKNNEIDCVLITVLGRENEIAAYLTDVVKINPKKIVTFDLSKRPVRENNLVGTVEKHYDLIGRLKKSKAIIGRYPLNVQIQTVSVCNAKCYFCPYVGSWHEENPGKMEDRTYKKIIDDLTCFKIKKFCPYFENEPLLDKKLFERIQYAVDVLKPEIVEISTNMSVVNDRIFKELCEILPRIPHEIRISFHGTNKDNYEEIMGLDFKRSISNVKKLILIMQKIPLNVSIRGSGQSRRDCGVTKCWFNEMDYRIFWSEQLSDFLKTPKIEFFTYHDRAKQKQLKRKGFGFDEVRKDLTEFYCSRFDHWAHFLYTGEPVLCCMDYNRETVFGNSVIHSSVNDLYMSDDFNKLIKQGTGLLFSKKNFICKRCISPGG